MARVSCLIPSSRPLERLTAVAWAFYLAPISRLVDEFSEVEIPVGPRGRAQKSTDLDRFRGALHGGDVVVDD
jgi:hypothetical protein